MLLPRTPTAQGTPPSLSISGPSLTSRSSVPSGKGLLPWAHRDSQSTAPAMLLASSVSHLLLFPFSYAEYSSMHDALAANFYSNMTFGQIFIKKRGTAREIMTEVVSMTPLIC